MRSRFPWWVVLAPWLVSRVLSIGVAVGQVLETWSQRVQIALLSVSAFGLVVFAFVVARYDLVP